MSVIEDSRYLQMVTSAFGSLRYPSVSTVGPLSPIWFVTDLTGTRCNSYNSLLQTFFSLLPHIFLYSTYINSWQQQQDSYISIYNDLHISSVKQSKYQQRSAIFFSKRSMSEHRAFRAPQIDLGQHKRTQSRLFRLIRPVFSNDKIFSDQSELILERTPYGRKKFLMSMQ